MSESGIHFQGALQRPQSHRLWRNCLRARASSDGLCQQGYGQGRGEHCWFRSRRSRCRRNQGRGRSGWNTNCKLIVKTECNRGGTYPLNDSWESLFPPEGSEWLDPGALEVVVSKAPARGMRYIEAQWQVEQFQQPGLASKW